MNQIRTVMGILRDGGSTVNTSCGMHIHIGMDTLTAPEQARVILNHCKWQSAFDAFITRTRQANSYAMKRTLSSASRLANAWVQNDGGARHGISNNEGRYYTLNLNSFYKYGTFEFRMHGGSLNGTNATAWIALHHGFIAACANDDLPNMLNSDLWADQATMDDLNASMLNATRTSRSTQKQASKVLLDHLRQNHYINADVYDYLIARACNLPVQGA